MTKTLLLPVLALGAAILALPAPARAEGGTKETHAERLFQDGLRLMKQDQCPQAIPRFVESQKLDPSAGTLSNLATCYARVGRNAAAYRTYNEAIGAAEREANAEVKERALKAMSLLEPQLSKLRLSHARASGATSLTLDGEPLALEDETTVPLDPGKHVVKASAPGQRAWERSFEATEQASIAIYDVPALTAEPPPAEPSRSMDLRTPALVVGGAGVAAVVVGSILGLSAKADYDNSGDWCLEGHCNATGHDLRERALDKAAASTWVVGLGAAAIATGVCLWVFSPSGSKEKVGLAPWSAGSQAVGVSLGGPL